ncbi:hypothetical protein RHGRI_000781 [Rhododendron griersonianum]|uniref:TIR domain-containing protein n=1 Tax=Rhododendron griersonianum TaxID=479676 RepID=A0AAV6LL88_9ERIC|nr:hypothetical protein RHGRI_000781 [Rhododendron griersonianum]
MNALREEGCSSSSIPIPPQWVYDVFVSFRGANTRKNFTSHLFVALEDNGFRTFRDDKELERGEFISDGLLKAIEGSRISLIVFSKDYAGSRWCLDELVRIMDCKETFKQIVVPIFYDVVPSDVRNQTRVLQDAFAKHEKRFREGSDGKVEKWRRALKNAADLSGRHLLNEANGDEAELIKMIIKDVREKVNPTHLNVPDRQVGLDRRVGELYMLLNMEFNCVGIVAIWSMGGIGKTTIAKRLYNLIQHKFERSGFLANVRETWQRPNGLDELQKKLLLAMLKRPHEVSNFHEGFGDIKKKAFGRKKVLLVLDDVDNVQQLEALAIDRDSFARGSRIIITTRDKSSLKILELGENEIYEPERLDEDESLKLFSWHAFKEDHPPKDHLELSHQIGHYAGGLPLALEVLGSYFRGESIQKWECAIAKLRKIHDDDIQGKLNISLKMSFDSLSKQLKNLFLDMACFFVGMCRDFTVKILEGCNISAEDGIRILANRCLIQYDYHDQIVMHDMIKDMGREMVRQESLEDPRKRSRLWYSDDVLEVLRDGTGTEAVKGLILNATDVQVNAKPFEKMDELWYREHVLMVRRDGMGTEVVEGRLLNFNDPKDVLVNAKAFEKMNNLWLLHLDYIHLDASYEHISRSLLWLSWKGFPLDCIPKNFLMQKLVALDLRYSSLEKVWNGSMGLSEIENVVEINVLLAGEEELRIWFPYCDGRGPNVSFVVPPSPSVNQKILGWILRFVVWAPRETPRQCPLVWIEDVICNKIQCWDGAFRFLAHPKDVDHVWLIYIPQGYGGLQLEGGDEVEISMSQIGANYVKMPIDVTHPNTFVKKWAIDLIYEADELHIGNDTWCQFGERLRSNLSLDISNGYI